MLKVHPKIGVVCLTRNKQYLSNRPIVLVFDYHELKYNMKVKPFCYNGYSNIHYPDQIWKPDIDEMEERCYGNINLKKYLKKIIINNKICYENNT